MSKSSHHTEGDEEAPLPLPLPQSPKTSKEAIKQYTLHHEPLSTKSSTSSTSPRILSPAAEAELIQKELAKLLVSALASRAYHLPGNSWWQDWRQYLGNNHPLLGICFHHRFHPIPTCMRVLALFGSILSGLTISNVIFLWALENETYNEPVLSLQVSSRVTRDGEPSVLEISNAMIIMWTAGGTLHALYDNLIWSVASCECCPNSKRGRSIGWYLGLMGVAFMATIATFIVMLRVNASDRGEFSSSELATDISNNELDVQDIGIDATSANRSDYKFLVGYLIEFALALMVYYPLIATIFFSGIFGCQGKIPILGGRPRDLIMEETEKRKFEKRRLHVVRKEEETQRVRDRKSKKNSKGLKSVGLSQVV